MPLHKKVLGALGLGGPTGTEKALRRVATSPFLGITSQGFLPPSLRDPGTRDILDQGIAGIGELISNPGGLGSNVSEAILPRLAVQSENIARDFRGIGSNQAGAAARSNLPLSIKNALSAALDVAQSRAQRGARRDALTDSEQLRRQDLSQTFAILDAILQFMSSGRGQAIQGLSAAGGIEQNRQSSNLAALSSLFPQAA